MSEVLSSLARMLQHSIQKSSAIVILSGQTGQVDIPSQSIRASA
jgi:hypothetical protein